MTAAGRAADHRAADHRDADDRAAGPRHRLTLTEPARRFVDGFLLGNGRLGAVLDGVPGSEGIVLNLDTLWSGGPGRSGGVPRDLDDDPAGQLARIRRAIEDGDFVDAERHSGVLWGEGFTESFQPLGRLEIRYPSSHPDSYERSLDLARGLAETSFTTDGAAVRVSAFVSAPDDVLCIDVIGGGVTSADVSFTSPHPSTTEHEVVPGGGPERWLSAVGRAPVTAKPEYLPEPDAVAVQYATDEPDAEGLVDSGMGWAVAVGIDRIEGGVRLLVAAESGFRGWDQRPSADLPSLVTRARRTVVRARAHGGQNLLERHIADHGSLFDRAELDLSRSRSASADRCETYFDLGRYLLIAGSRPGTEPLNLQGIWNDRVRPPWSSNLTTNINVQMNYWPAERTGLGELAEPLARLVSELAVAGRDTARSTYGLGGAAVHHNTDLWRFSDAVPLDAQWSNWPTALLWLAAHVHRGVADDPSDDASAVRALHAIEPAVAFGLDLLVDDAEGNAVVSPSTSPEHRFRPDASSAFSAVSAGSTMDQELVFESLRDYLALAARTGRGDERIVEGARRALERLRLPGIGSDGTLLEWAAEYEPLELGHRHLSHLYGLYPGTRITELGTPEQFEAARRALALRLEHGGGYTGWSKAWVLCLAARLRDRELAAESLSDLLGPLASESLLDLHPVDSPDGVVFQIDGNFGGTAGIAELLLQDVDGVVALLPTLPSDWSAGDLRGFRVRGGHSVDVSWSDGRLTAATLRVASSGVIVELADDGSDVSLTGPEGAVVPKRLDAAPVGRRRLTWAGEGSYRLLLRPPAPRDEPVW